MVNALLSQLFFGMCCRSEWQERMYIYKWHEVDQTKHEIFCVHIVCNEIQVKVNLEITTFFFYLRFPYCPNFFWFGVVYIVYTYIYLFCLLCGEVLISRLVSRILSVSALAWPFVVEKIRKMCSSASRKQCKEILFERSSLDQRMLKADRKCIYMSH